MKSLKNIIFIFLILFFLLSSFYPAYFEISNAGKIDPRREFILEHNFYWPDFNLYLSKIRQGWQGSLTAKERYTSEPHEGSLIQEFYVVLGRAGRVIGLDPNGSYQLGRVILSPLLALIILLFTRAYFKQFFWRILALLIIFSSGSFPHIYSDSTGIHIARFMEWWSNIDAVQRMTFIPHILAGQVGSFLLLYILAIKKVHLTTGKFLFLILLGNAVGITFPPSLITLDGVLLIMAGIHFLKSRNHRIDHAKLLFIFFSLPSLLYIFFVTRTLPWSSLVEFHRTHPMMIPFDQYVLGTGPVFFLGILGSILAIFRRKTRLYPLILWIVTTLLFASFFSIVKEQSPLRFTQTGLFIPLGILTTYFFYQLFQISQIRLISLIGITTYLLLSFFMLTVSLSWQTTFISQRIGATIPLVPYPPQTMYPLKSWMDAIRWLRDHTGKDDVVAAAITAGNFIPAYSGNTVYFGQSNTVDYNRKAQEVDTFFSGKMFPHQAELFLKNGRIKYIFFSFQEKEFTGGKNLNTLYPFLKPAYSNTDVTIYTN